MRFLVDRCVGRRLAEWLASQGHDALDARTLGADPGDSALLELAASTNRVLITLDSDFGQLVYQHNAPQAGLIRLPDVPTPQRIEMVAEIIEQYAQALADQAVVTVRGERIRISHPPIG